MFTGIVEELGVVGEADGGLVVESVIVASDSGPGASVAVNGVCLTVTERGPGADGRPSAALRFDLSAETLRRTALGRLRRGDRVNLERPVTLLARLGGHLVQGHVDGVATVAGIEPTEGGCEMTFELPPGLERYIVEKGSVTVDGVSLTVTGVRGRRFGVALVPFTLEATTLGRAAVGDPVNVEVDMVAKYVERLTQARPGRR